MKIIISSIFAVLYSLIFSVSTYADRQRSGAISHTEASPVRPRSSATPVLPNKLAMSILTKLQSMEKPYTDEDVLNKFTQEEIEYVVRNGAAVAGGKKLSALDSKIDDIADHDAFSRANLKNTGPL